MLKQTCIALSARVVPVLVHARRIDVKTLPSKERRWEKTTKGVDCAEFLYQDGTFDFLPVPQ